ncbi:bifunctional diguanylate cyclase/phosphodiesterase [Actinoplanes oblitus]|uniref:Bifunctional diguanylate cyclase/phosphodiesterase n=1 Tax=Actinoplanes oblitus TaxID=3040509 RepID=A0ABY8W522_9ACTN|nr:bifunctional diguanylate cyclase/phosphodiesterase [Actinoplanes oblitus]WIM92949.1 bifunctional diguanylate cyclase/phosphodiesterase [Actinoplanes oblitus]
MSRWYLGVGALLGAALLMTPASWRMWLYTLVAVMVVTALCAGIHRHRPVWSRPWWLLVATVGASVLANIGWAASMTPSGAPRFPSAGDLFYLVSMGMLLTSVYWWVRPGRYRGGLLDAAIALAGGAAVVWVAVVAPLLSGGRYSGLRLAGYLCYVGFDLLILALTVRVAVVSRVRTVAYRLMVGAAALWVTADTVFYATLPDGAPVAADWVQAGWLTAYLMIGAAALHPSMARSTGSMPRNAALLTRTRLLGYVVLSMLVAGLAVAETAGVASGDGAWRVIVLLCLGCLTSVLLIGRLAQLGAALNQRAHVDPLTGLGNRAALQDALVRRTPEERVLLVLDIDGFRDINATFGHKVGDAVLTESGHRLRAATPSDAVVVRLDADAFAVLARGGEQTLGGLAERLLRALAEPYPTAGLTSRRIRASIGAVAIRAGQDGAGALRDADLALRTARDEGNGTAVFDPAAYARWRANRDLIADLQHALGTDELSMHYQPIVDLESGRIVAAEALLRWTRPDGTAVSPAHFIPLAEQSGDITLLGEWVLGRVCSDLTGLWAAHRLPVTVNISAHQLRDAGFATRLLERLERAGLPGAALIAEITETVLVTTVTDAATTISQLQQLREHGVRIAVDDFGTGYSSLAYLRELPVDILKMDGSFTSRQIEAGSPREIAFVRTIVELGRSLDLCTLAEAVETEAQAQRLRELGCHLAQGYHFARPAPVAVLHDLLAAQRAPSTGTAA